MRGTGRGSEPELKSRQCNRHVWGRTDYCVLTGPCRSFTSHASRPSALRRSSRASSKSRPERGQSTPEAARQPAASARPPRRSRAEGEVVDLERAAAARDVERVELLGRERAVVVATLQRLVDEARRRTAVSARPPPAAAGSSPRATRRAQRWRGGGRRRGERDASSAAAAGRGRAAARRRVRRRRARRRAHTAESEVEPRERRVAEGDGEVGALDEGVAVGRHLRRSGATEECGAVGGCAVGAEEESPSTEIGGSRLRRTACRSISNTRSPAHHGGGD